MLSTTAASVYKSAADAFAKQNKELYPNMLDSLTQLMQQSTPTEDAASDLLDDQRMRFHFTHVLPLLFDADAGLQQKAIDTIEAVLPHMKNTTFDTLPDWPAIKDTISEQYCKDVNTLRDRHNSNWHQVWSILVRLIHKDILRSATLINRYLSIVEQGFRNANLTVRAEAFLCWHVLVQLFATHNELLAPKRIKLVCIPLKSSQSKTEQIAVNKFSVWWFLMSEVHDRLVDYTDTIVEPFLVFCFGPLGIQPLIGLATTTAAPITAPGKTFEKLTPMCVGALCSLLGAPDAATAALVERVGLLALRQPFDSAGLFAKIGKALINSAGEATLMVAKLTAEERRNEIAADLWRHVMNNVNTLRCYDHFNLVLDNVYALQNCTTHNPALIALTAHVVHTIASAPSFILSNADADIDRVFVCIQRVLLLLLSTTIVYTDDQIRDVLDVWLNIDAISGATGCSFRELTKRLMKFVTNARPGNISAVRLALWHKLADQFVQHRQQFTATAAQLDVVERELLHAFVVAPIAILPDQFDAYRTRWLTMASNVLDMDGGRDGFTRRALAALRLHPIRAPIYNVILAALIDLEEHDFAGPLPEHLFDHVDYLCATSSAATTIKDLNVIVHALVAFVKRLDGPQLLRSYQRLKAVHGRIEATVPTLRCDRAACAEFRSAVAQHVRTRKPTQALIRELGAGDEAVRKELLDMLNVDSDFVVIPSVWRFNPDRLTDQQRDKMRERRADIPALYNDTSQSQESRSIKPWTPQKMDVAPQATTAATVVMEPEHADGAKGDQTAAAETAAVTATATATIAATTSTAVTTEPTNEPNSPESSASSQATTSVAPKRETNELRKLRMDIVAVDEYLHRSSSERSTRKTNTIGCSPSSRSASPAVGGAERGSSVSSSADERENAAEAPKKTKMSAERPELRMRRRSVDGSALQSPSHTKDKRVTRQRPATATRPRLGQITESASDQQQTETTKAGKTPKMRRLVYPTTVGEKAATPGDKSKPAEPSKEIVLETILIDSEEPLAADDVIETSQDPLQSPVKSATVRVVLDRIKTTPAVMVAVVDTQNMDTVPMDTECAADVPELADQMNGDRIEEALNAATAKKTVVNDSVDGAVAVADTQSQPSQLSTLNITVTEEEEDTPKPMDVTEQASDELLPTDAVDLDASVIRCSPECNDLDQRNAELLNNTLTISPIRVIIVPEGSTDIVDISTLVNLPVNAQPAFIPSVIAPLVSSSTSSPPSSQTSRAVSSTPVQTQTINSPSSRYSQFKGRGAQLLNIIANKKKKPNDDPTTSAVDIAACPKTTADDIRDAFEDAQPLAALPTPKRNLLTFSKTLPSPLASPSSSILKRKLPADDTADASTIDAFSTPVLKKKRVSFHDPPVSVTKEYIGHADEHNDRSAMAKLHLQQQLTGVITATSAGPSAAAFNAAATRSPAFAKSPNNNHSAANNFNRVRNVLQRKSRADSMVEFAKLNRINATSSPLGGGSAGSSGISHEQIAAATTSETMTPTAAAANSVGLCTTADMEPLQWNSSTVSVTDEAIDTEPRVNRATVDADSEDMISTAELDELITPAPASLRAYDQAAILRHVREHCPLDQVLAAFVASPGGSSSSSVVPTAVGRLLTRELSALMRTDERVCRETLEQLSEEHSAQFLNHAIVENLGSTVCARLAPTVLIDHLRGVAQTDGAVRTDLLAMLVQTAATDAAAEEVRRLEVGTRETSVALAGHVKTATETRPAETTPVAKDVRVEAVQRLLDDRQTDLGADEMAVMRRLLDRPLSDQQICDFMGIFSRNRQN